MVTWIGRYCASSKCCGLLYAVRPRRCRNVPRTIRRHPFV